MIEQKDTDHAVAYSLFAVAYLHSSKNKVKRNIGFRASALQHVGSYLGYTGRDADGLGKAASDPLLTI